MGTTGSTSFISTLIEALCRLSKDRMEHRCPDPRPEMGAELEEMVKVRGCRDFKAKFLNVLLHAIIILLQFSLPAEDVIIKLAVFIVEAIKVVPPPAAVA